MNSENAGNNKQCGRRPPRNKFFRTMRFSLLALLFPSVKAGVYRRIEAC